MLDSIYVCLPISWVGPPAQQILGGHNCRSRSQEGWARAASLSLPTLHPQYPHCTTARGKWWEETISLGHVHRWLLTFLTTCNIGKTVFLVVQHFLSSDCGVLSYHFNFSFSLNDLMKGINVASSSCYSSSSQPFSHPSMSAHPPIPSWQGCHRGYFPRYICSHQKRSEAENSVKDWNGKEEEKRSSRRGRVSQYTN